MPDDDKNYSYIAKTLFGLEEVLAKELLLLGAENISKLTRAVEFSGDQRLLYHANLSLRTATRVLKPIKTFKASDGDKLYHQVYAINWDRFLTPDMTIAVDATVLKSGIDNSMFAALRVKDAIVDQLRKRHGARPSVDTANPDLRLNLHLNDNQATLALDSSGESLSRRGYRRDAGVAPLSEALAAGIVLLSEWDKETPLIDPMCGSGTIVIEAALMAMNMAPGLLRHEFGFMSWKDFDAELFRQIQRQAQADVRTTPKILIHASDIDPVQIKNARANAARAKVSDWIEFHRRNFFKTENSLTPATVIMNPPYGERLSSVEDIEKLYAEIGDTLKQSYSGCTAHLLTSNSKAAKRVGLRASRKIALYNGPLECKLLRYDLYSGSLKTKHLSPDAGKVLPS